MFAGQVSIIGAGLSGLIAAHAWKRAQIFESAPSPHQLHQALLRFRSDAVSRLVGIPFRKVLVRKGIVHDGEFCTPNIRLANMYSRKVTGGLYGDRSIWNLEAVERYIAPADFYARLVDHVMPRIRWAVDGLDACNGHTPIVSTAPLGITVVKKGMSDMLNAPLGRSSIFVARYGVDADINQTIYFPGNETPVYRASVTGSTLIVEAMSKFHDEHLAEVMRCFDLDDCSFDTAVEQKHGKIVPLEAATRKRVLYALTKRHNIYSLGRFATWRNILLDDVVHDIEQIDAMIGSSDYERSMRAAR